MRRVALFTIFLAWTLHPGISLRGQGPGSDSEAAQAIEAAAQAWLDAYTANDAQKVANLYSEDAIYAANTGEVLKGRDGIRKGVANWMASRPQQMQLRLERESLRLRVHDDVAHDLSRFEIHAVQQKCIINAGHALTVWRKQSDGAWRIETHLVNRDPQPPEGACGRGPGEVRQ